MKGFKLRTVKEVEFVEVSAVRFHSPSSPSLQNENKQLFYCSYAHKKISSVSVNIKNFLFIIISFTDIYRNSIHSHFYSAHKSLIAEGSKSSDLDRGLGDGKRWQLRESPVFLHVIING